MRRRHESVPSPRLRRRRALSGPRGANARRRGAAAWRREACIRRAHVAVGRPVGHHPRDRRRCESRRRPRRRWAHARAVRVVPGTEMVGGAKGFFTPKRARGEGRLGPPRRLRRRPWRWRPPLGVGALRAERRVPRVAHAAVGEAEAAGVRGARPRQAAAAPRERVATVGAQYECRRRRRPRRVPEEGADLRCRRRRHQVAVGVRRQLCDAHAAAARARAGEVGAAGGGLGGGGWEEGAGAATRWRW